ncbi:hypothetical protein EDC01DRAFT_778900 [Geopyxis carbonaria]|nr:hypothetical protein EDC01DRAFT_778900 [Geopyxis carbonaria]
MGLPAFCAGILPASIINTKTAAAAVAPPSAPSARSRSRAPSVMNLKTNHNHSGAHASSLNAARSTVATTAVMIPALLAIGAATWLYDLYSYRRRYSRSPAYHPSLLLRPSPATTALSDPANRIFNVRADRNILASGLMDHCHFDAEVLESQSRLICKLPRSRMKAMLEFFVGVKKEVDRAHGLLSPLPYDTPDIPAQAVEREWVQRCAGGLRAAAKAASLDPEMAREMDTAGAFEVWEVVVRNRCRGWVVEPYHLELNSLDDDDEMPFTWTNTRGQELKGFGGRWPKRGTTSFAGVRRSVRPPLPMRRRSTGGSGGMGGIRSPRLQSSEWGAVEPAVAPGVAGGWVAAGRANGLGGVPEGGSGWESIDGVRNVDVTGGGRTGYAGWGSGSPRTQMASPRSGRSGWEEAPRRTWGDGTAL